MKRGRITLSQFSKSPIVKGMKAKIQVLFVFTLFASCHADHGGNSSPSNGDIEIIDSFGKGARQGRQNNEANGLFAVSVSCI